MPGGRSSLSADRVCVMKLVKDPISQLLVAMRQISLSTSLFAAATARRRFLLQRRYFRASEMLASLSGQ